jgi:hypothetical protein
MIYAKIQNGIVINMQIASSSDYFDPTYVWVDVDSIQCIEDGSPVQINCTYDGTNFHVSS